MLQNSKTGRLFGKMLIVSIVMMALVVVSGCTNSTVSPVAGITGTPEVNLESCADKIKTVDDLDVGIFKWFKAADEQKSDRIIELDDSVNISHLSISYFKEDENKGFKVDKNTVINNVDFKIYSDDFLEKNFADISKQIDGKITHEKRFGLETVVMIAENVPENEKINTFSTHYAIKVPDKKTVFIFSSNARISYQEAEAFLKEYFVRACENSD